MCRVWGPEGGSESTVRNQQAASTVTGAAAVCMQAAGLAPKLVQV